MNKWLERDTNGNDILRYQNRVKMKSAKICNCKHVIECAKNMKNPKSPIEF